jgi:hypothetical protein
MRNGNRISGALRGSLHQRIAWLLLLVPALALGESGGSPRMVYSEPTRLSEHFVLEWVGESPHPHRGYDGIRGLEHAARAGQLGLVEFHRREVAGGWQLEQEIQFPFEGLRILAVECLSARSPRLVWREIGATGGRTIFAEWTSESERLKVLEWGNDGGLRESLGTSKGAVMPQYLLELAREGKLAGGRFEVFDPLRSELDQWTMEVRYLREDEGVARETPGYSKQVEFRRTDGSLAGRYLFHGQRLLSFQWQEGHVRARRISDQEHAQLWDRWNSPESGALDPMGSPQVVKDL